MNGTGIVFADIPRMARITLPQCAVSASSARQSGSLCGRFLCTVSTDIPQIPGVVERDFLSHRGALQRNSIATASVRSQIVELPASQCWNSLLCLHQGAPLPSPSAASDPHLPGGARGDGSADERWGAYAAGRLEVLRDLDQRRLTSAAAAQLLGLERRQVFRLLEAYRTEGPAGLISKRRDRRSNRASRSRCGERR